MSALSTSPEALLRPGLLDGVAVLLCGAPYPGVPAEASRPFGSSLARALALSADVFAADVGAACAALGASVSSCAPLTETGAVAEEAALDARIADVLREAGGVDLLVVAGADFFAHGLAVAGDGHAALRACMDGAWSATRAVVNRAFLALSAAGEAGAGGPAQGADARGGRIVYLAPAADAGAHADAARAGLENLARTLSIEWARHGITTVAIAPGADTPTEQVATLVAYLASPAGAYFSGCLLDLRGVAGT